MGNRAWPTVRRLALPSALGLTLVLAIGCSPGTQVPPVQVTVLSPTPAPVVQGTPVAGARAVPAVLTANASGNSITLIDPTTQSVLETINVGFPARSVALTPDGRYAFIVNGTSGANTVVVYDLITKARRSEERRVGK